MKEHPNTNIKSDTTAKRCKTACTRHSILRRFSTIRDNKRGYSTEGSTLLPSVLRPRLFGIGKDKKDKFFNVSFGKNITKENPDEVTYEFNLNLRLGLLTIVAICLGIAAINVINVSAVSATISVPSSVNINVNPSSNNGFAESNNGAVSVSTSNQAGYTLTIKAKDNNQLKNGNSVLNSISTNLTADQYKNGDYVNTWGFKPSSINNGANTSYVPGPTTSGITLAKTNINSTSAENYSLGIAAKVDSNTVAGNYTNTFTLTATANEARYTIKYDATSLSGATNAGSFPTESNIITGDTQVINSTEPTKSGTDFLGWCDELLQSDGSCKGSVIQAGGNLRMCKCNTEVTLYAMWGTKPITPGTNGADCTVAGHNGKYYGGYCWQWMDASGGSTWSEAKTVCNSMGWSLPTQDQFQSLLNAIGTGSQLYEAGWKSGSYWSSTPNGSNVAFGLYVTSSNATITSYRYFNPGATIGVRCVSQ